MFLYTLAPPVGYRVPITRSVDVIPRVGLTLAATASSSNSNGGTTTSSSDDVKATLWALQGWVGLGGYL